MEMKVMRKNEIINIQLSKEKEEALKRIFSELLNRDGFIISSHVNPDFDSIGSIIALTKFLKSIGKDVIILHPSPHSYLFEFLPDYKSLVIPFQDAKDIDVDKYKNVIVLDSGDLERLGEKLKKILAVKPFILNIDHHKQNGYFGTINYVDEEASSTGEIIFELLYVNRVEIDKEIGKYILVAIIGDTGGFRFDGATYNTFQITSYLVSQGIKLSTFMENMFQNRSWEYMKLLSFVLSNLKATEDRRVVWSVVRYEDIVGLGLDPKDQGIYEGLVEELGIINTVKVYFLVTEREKGYIHISFRCKGDAIDVSEIARKWGGGGHKRASGLTVDYTKYGGVEKFIEMVLKEIQISLGN